MTKLSPQIALWLSTGLFLTIAIGYDNFDATKNCVIVSLDKQFIMISRFCENYVLIFTKFGDIIQKNIADEKAEAQKKAAVLRNNILAEISPMNTQIDELKKKRNDSESRIDEIQIQIQTVNAKMIEAQKELDANH